MKYEYGVEYETNGNKPDLPDDVLVEFFGIGGEWRNKDYVKEWNWKYSYKFRIVDQRYKPVDVEQVQSDNSLKVGEQVSFPSGCGVVVVVDEDKNGVIIVKDDSGEYRRVARAVIERKADEEKWMFVNSACSAIEARGIKVYSEDEPYFIALYDAGCRFTGKTK